VAGTQMLKTQKHNRKQQREKAEIVLHVQETQSIQKLNANSENTSINETSCMCK